MRPTATPSSSIADNEWKPEAKYRTRAEREIVCARMATAIPLAPSYPDWSSSMQAYYAPGATPPAFFASTVASPTPHPYMWGSQHPLIPSYGTPVPYPAIYPPGNVYAHHSMATHGTEFVGKGPDGKDRVSAKSSKGMSANTGCKALDNRKAGSGSGNDGVSQSAESGSEGSSDASDENINQQESATNKKGSFDQMLVDGANAQNNSVGATPQSSVPGRPVGSMSATSLNIGMDLWNASPAGAEAAKMRHNQSAASGVVTPPTIMGREVALGEKWIQDERELKRQKRKQSNRESARRSRLRKQAECEELQKRLESLGSENRTLREELQGVSEECKKLTSENNSIKEELERLCGPEAVANLE
ncbi:G-box-binding factor 1 [Spatholobus suberectus]|nr:G-box-binding factor 1 [Spatholobus suberectus]